MPSKRAFDIQVPFNANEPEKSGDFDISSVARHHQVPSKDLVAEPPRHEARGYHRPWARINPARPSDVPSKPLEAMREGRCGIGELDIRDVDRLSVQDRRSGQRL